MLVDCGVLQPQLHLTAQPCVDRERRQIRPAQGAERVAQMLVIGQQCVPMPPRRGRDMGVIMIVEERVQRRGRLAKGEAANHAVMRWFRHIHGAPLFAYRASFCFLPASVPPFFGPPKRRVKTHEPLQSARIAAAGVAAHFERPISYRANLIQRKSKYKNIRANIRNSMKCACYWGGIEKQYLRYYCPGGHGGYRCR